MTKKDIRYFAQAQDEEPILDFLQEKGYGCVTRKPNAYGVVVAPASLRGGLGDRLLYIFPPGIMQKAGVPPGTQQSEDATKKLFAFSRLIPWTRSRTVDSKYLDQGFLQFEYETGAHQDELDAMVKSAYQEILACFKDQGFKKCASPEFKGWLITANAEAAGLTLRPG